jgi:hypothetical protein
MDDDKRRKNQRKPSQSKHPDLDGADADSDTLSLPAASAAFPQPSSLRLTQIKFVGPIIGSHFTTSIQAIIMLRGARHAGWSDVTEGDISELVKFVCFATTVLPLALSSFLIHNERSFNDANIASDGMGLCDCSLRISLD